MAFLSPLESDRWLGFVDIALPGLLVSYLLRFDTINRRIPSRTYFELSVAGYMCGLLLTTLVWVVSDMPALLFLVPSTLGPTIIVAKLRRELHLLWLGLEPTEQSELDTSARQAGRGRELNPNHASRLSDVRGAWRASCVGKRRKVLRKET